MKINIFLNNYRPEYEQREKRSVQNIPMALIEKIYRPEHQYILRGEPTLHPKFREILSIFEEHQNYILTTEVANLPPLLGYQGNIPYISFCYDGFQSDQLRGNRNLTYNVQKAISYFSAKPTTMRIEYIISRYNYQWILVDLVILKRFMELYPKMKQPYFLIYQDGDYFKNNEFHWVPLTWDMIKKMNGVGVLTQKNMDFLNAFMMRKNFSCIALKNELVIMNDGTARLCMSRKMDNVIGDINVQSLEDVISSTQPIREACSECEYKLSCWLAYHYKDNIFAQEEDRRNLINLEDDDIKLITT